MTSRPHAPYGEVYISTTSTPSMSPRYLILAETLIRHFPSTGPFLEGIPPEYPQSSPPQPVSNEPIE